MDFLKKAKSQAKAAVQDAQGMYNTYKQQQAPAAQPPQAPTAQAGYQQSHQAYGSPQAYAPQQTHQAPYNYQQQGQQASHHQHQPQPGYGYQPAHPGYQQPTQPGHQQPIQPGHQQPIPPSYQQPIQPTQPGHQQPIQPGHQQPTQPSYQQPAQPNYQQQPNTAPYSQAQHHGQHQPPAPSYAPSQQQHLYQQPGPPTPPAQPFDMNSLQQALPGSALPGSAPQAPYSPSSIQSPPPLQKAAAPPAAAHYSPPGSAPPPAPSAAPDARAVRPPVSTAATHLPCPRHEATLVDKVQFYVFKTGVLSQVQPALDKDNFAACAACFNAHIAPHPDLASNFEPRQKTAADPAAPQASFEKLYCDLALPSIRQVFYQQAVPQRSVMPLLQMTKYLITLPSCDGSAMQDSEAYSSKRGDGFATCKTCFEWFIRNTPFEHELVLENLGSGWFCDIGARGYLYRVIVAELESQHPDFGRFSEKSKKRNALPPCNGENPIVSAGAGPHFVFEPPSGATGLVCQSCFWDKILGTSMEPFFNKYIQLDAECTSACDLGTVQSSYAMQVASKRGSDEIWRRCLTSRHTIPGCKGLEGVDEEDLQGQDPASSQWYCFTKYPLVEVCPWCYSAKVELWGAGHLFSPITRPLRPGMPRMCFLTDTQRPEANISDQKQFESSLAWRGTTLRLWLEHGYQWDGNFHGLQHVARYFSTLPPPCASNKRAIKPASGRKWYGNHFLCKGDDSQLGIRVCEECYQECIQGTALEWFIGCDLTEKTREELPQGHVCGTRDREARDKMRDACENNDFLRFAHFWAERKKSEDLKQTAGDLSNQMAQQQMMAMTYNNHLASMNLMQQLNYNTNATIWRI